MRKLIVTVLATDNIEYEKGDDPPQYEIDIPNGLSKQMIHMVAMGLLYQHDWTQVDYNERVVEPDEEDK